jgi:hypothetical protein
MPDLPERLVVESGAGFQQIVPAICAPFAGASEYGPKLSDDIHVIGVHEHILAERPESTLARRHGRKRRRFQAAGFSSITPDETSRSGVVGLRPNASHCNRGERSVEKNQAGRLPNDQHSTLAKKRAGVSAATPGEV